jgi:hypothetical protein
MSAEELAHALREDDFLYIKFGSLKPRCEPLRWSPPTAEAAARAAEIRAIVEQDFGDALRAPAEPRFAFLEKLCRTGVDPEVRDAKAAPTRFALRFIYSYFAVYGDPLSDPALDPYPDGLLERLAAAGVDGVWLHVVLRQLAPGGKAFPEFGEGHERRLATLRGLVDRAKRRGIAVYLYMNEPRAMPEAFFKDRPGMAGVREGDHLAMCTSDPAVRSWIAGALAHVFKEVPGLGGVFTITGSENLTNCASHHQHKGCARCKDRAGADILADINAAIEEGVHRSASDAKVIVWDWGWPDEWAPDVIPRLPKSCWLMSVSEWSLPIERGGVKSQVGEYSISAVGPGPRATKHWALAKAAGLRTVAKVQINNSWEFSATPYLPVLDLVAEHCRRLAGAGVDGLMLGWSLGGHPSPNLEVADRFARTPTPAADEALDAVARARFGPEGAPHAREAWTAFSRAFTEYPFNIGVVYRCPVQYGPANLLQERPTGYASGMIAFPYDHLDGWRGPYPPEVFAGQFAKVADGWAEGLDDLARAAAAAPPALAADAKAELRFARAARIHFRSVANQTRFVLARDDLAAAKMSEAALQERRAEVRRILEDEMALAKELFALAREDSRIGFEASNHYYYVPMDLMEKAVNCRDILTRMTKDE